MQSDRRPHLALLVAALLAAIAVAAVGGCGGAAQRPGPGAPATAAGGNAAGATGAQDAAGAPPAPLSRNECATMLEHVVELQVAEQRKRLPAEQVPTAEQVGTIKAELVVQQTEACLPLPRAVYDCVMGAEDLQRYLMCAQ